MKASLDALLPHRHGHASRFEISDKLPVDILHSDQMT